MESPWQLQFLPAGIELVIGMLLVLLPGRRGATTSEAAGGAGGGGFLESAAFTRLARALGLVLVAVAVREGLTVPATTPGGQPKHGVSGRPYTELKRVDLYRGADPGVVFCIAEQDAETAADVVRTLSSPHEVPFQRFAVVVSIRRYAFPVLRPRVAAFVFTSGADGWRPAQAAEQAPLLAAAKDLCRGRIPAGG